MLMNATDGEGRLHRAPIHVPVHEIKIDSVDEEIWRVLRQKEDAALRMALAKRVAAGTPNAEGRLLEHLRLKEPWRFEDGD